MKKVLFVCRANKLRSLTAEHMFLFDKRFIAKSAGINKSAAVCISSDLIAWADWVLVMKSSYIQIIFERFPEWNASEKFISLDIEDIYTYMDPKLMDILREKVDQIIGKE